VADHNTSVFAQYTIRVPNREEFCTWLQKIGIPTAIHYPVPLTKQPLLQDMDCAKVSLPHTEKAAAEVVSLPMHPYLMLNEIEFICKTIRDLVLDPVAV
jgi:UDP-2-acetamido-2-deoxy-ribo-hexuluronate aminotransferase